MITKQQYLRNEASYRDYFRDIALASGVTLPDSIREAVERPDGRRTSIAMGNYPEWAEAAVARREALTGALEERGDYWDVHAGVCALVAIARERGK